MSRSARDRAGAMGGADKPQEYALMALTPVAFVTASPVEAVQRVERLRRGRKSAKSSGVKAGQGPQLEPIEVAQAAEDYVGDEMRDALLSLRLGG